MTIKARHLSRLSSTFAANADDARSLMQQAQAAAQQAASLAPQSSAAHVILGSIYFWSFRFTPALHEFEVVGSLDNRSGADLAQIAWMFAMLRHFDPALRLADEAVALDPLNSAVHQDRGNVLLCANRLPEAEQAVQRAWRLNGGLWYTHLLYAMILLKAKRFAEAQQEVAKVGRKSMSVIATEAIVAERLGDQSRSNRLLHEMLSSTMVDAVHYQIAQVYAQQGRPADALSWHCADAGRFPS